MTGLSEHSEETMQNMSLVSDTRRLEQKPEKQACHQLLKTTNYTGDLYVANKVFAKFT